MKRLFFCLLFFGGAFAWSDDPKPEKPISELQFYKQLFC